MEKVYNLLKLWLVEEVEQVLLKKRIGKIKYTIQGDSTVTTWLKQMIPLIGNITLLHNGQPFKNILEFENKIKLMEEQKQG